MSEVKRLIEEEVVNEIGELSRMDLPAGVDIEVKL